MSYHFCKMLLPDDVLSSLNHFSEYGQLFSNSEFVVERRWFDNCHE